MQKIKHPIHSFSKRLSGFMGALMLLSGAVMPYQGIPLTKPVVIRALGAEPVSVQTAVTPDAAAEAAETKPVTTTAAAVTTVTATADPVTVTTAEQPETVQDEESGFVFSVYGGTVTVNSYTGEETAVTIPESFQGKPVTAIADKAFSNHKTLVSAEIPSGVRTIGQYAFSGCTALKKVTLPEKLEDLGYGAFANTALTEITIPALLKSGSEAFYGCKSLKTVNFGKDIAEIPVRLFADCPGITEIEIPETVTQIGEYAFSGSGIKNITLPEKLEDLGYGAFANTALTEITIPASLKSGSEAFYGCKSLKAVTFGKGIAEIPVRLFADCPGITEIEIPETVTQIGEYAFSSSGIKNITLPGKLEDLGYCAFANTALTEITIPASLKSGKQAFYGCKALKKVTLSEGMKEIPEKLFSDCAALTAAEIPDTVTVIGDSAFSRTGLTEITIPAGVSTIGSYAFSESGLKAVDLPSSVRTVKAYAFAGCTALEKATLHEGLETLDQYAFTKTALTAIRIPASLKFAPNPFANCETLRYAEFAKGTVNVPDRLFHSAVSLEKIRLADTTVSLGREAFYCCRSLREIEPAGISPVYRSTTFSGCDLLLDERFTNLDRSGTCVSVNSAVSPVSGLVHFTVKYKMKVHPKQVVLQLAIPESLTIVPDSLTCSAENAEISRNFDAVRLRETEAVLHFSARVTKAETAEVSAFLSYDYNSASWQENLGTVTVEAPALTINAPEKVSSLSALISGAAGKNQPVEIYVNDKLALEATANRHTGKYSAEVTLPAGSDGTVYQIYAKTDDAKTEAVSVTYCKEAPVIESVTFSYNQHFSITDRKDITDVFLSGASPVISFNPHYPLQFFMKISNSQAIDKVYVTSTRGSDMKYMEAFYNAEKDEWSTESNYFDPHNRSYVPGSLNISIIEKGEAEEEEIVLEESDVTELQENLYAADNLPKNILEHSTAEIISQTDESIVVKANFSNGKEDNPVIYCAEKTDTIKLSGKTVTAEQIAKEPEKYGYTRSLYTYEDEEGTHVFYQRFLDDEDAVTEATIRGLSEGFSEFEGIVSGTSILEFIEKDYYGEDYYEKHEFGFSLRNETVAFYGSQVLDQISHETFGKQLKVLGVVSDLAEMTERIYDAETEEDIYIAGIIGGVKILIDIGAVEGVTAILIGTSAPALLIGGAAAFVVGAGVDYLADRYYEYMETHATFSLGGFMRFLIDPSGIVYEAVLSNPVAGAEVRLYYLDPETGEQTEWNASDFEQINPIITDADGAYAWDVPEGKWKVVAAKEGYDTAESEWMDVPPIRTDVMLPLVDHSAPEIADIRIRDDGLLVRFSKFIDISTASAESILLKGAAEYSVLPVLHAPQDTYTDQFLLSGIIPAGAYTVSAAKTLKSYAGTAAVTAGKKITLEKALRMKGDLNGDNQRTVADLVLMNRILAEDTPETGVFEDASVWTAADMDSDGIVTVLDIRAFQKLLLAEKQ